MQGGPASADETGRCLGSGLLRRLQYAELTRLIQSRVTGPRAECRTRPRAGATGGAVL